MSPYDDGWLFEDVEYLKLQGPIEKLEELRSDGSTLVKLYNRDGYRVGPTIRVTDVISSARGDA